MDSQTQESRKRISFWLRDRKFGSYKEDVDKKAIDIEGRVVIYTVLGCPVCRKAKTLLREEGLPFQEVRFDIFPEIEEKMKERIGSFTLPLIYFNDTKIGGINNLKELLGDDVKKKGERVYTLLRERHVGEFPFLPLQKAKSSGLDVEINENSMEMNSTYVSLHTLRREGILRTHGNCLCAKHNSLVGSEFIAFVMDHLDIDRSQAIRMGQEFLDRRLPVNHRMNTPIFKDSDAVYVILDMDERSALNYDIDSKKIVGDIAFFMRKRIHKLYGSYLSIDGKTVDYAGMRGSVSFQVYKQMASKLMDLDVESYSNTEKMAFFINCYNAMVVHWFVEKGAPSGRWQRRKFFRKAKYLIGGMAFSLDDIEHGVLRANQRGRGYMMKPFGYSDPRRRLSLTDVEPLIHFGLVYGCKSSPLIRLYDPTMVMEQLKNAAKNFLDNDRGMILDQTTGTIRLSPIFKWYMKDFGGSTNEIVKYIAMAMGSGTKRETFINIVQSQSFKVKFLPWNWAFNNMTPI